MLINLKSPILLEKIKNNFFYFSLLIDFNFVLYVINKILNFAFEDSYFLLTKSKALPFQSSTTLLYLLLSPLLFIFPIIFFCYLLIFLYSFPKTNSEVARTHPSPEHGRLLQVALPWKRWTWIKDRYSFWRPTWGLGFVSLKFSCAFPS